MTTIYPDTVALSPLDYTPLTTDNLKKKGLYDLDVNVPPTLLERYCQDILTVSPNSIVSPMNEPPKRRKQRSTSSNQSKSRPSSQRRQSSSVKSSTSTNRDNTVMESPRLLPFPYHNDSLFLPTVEQHRRMERARSVASIKTSSTYGNHHYPITNNINSNIPSTLSSEFSSPGLATPARRQSSAPPILSSRRKIPHSGDDPAQITSPPSKTERLQPKRPAKTSNSAHLPSSSKSTSTSTSSSSSSWLRKIWKFLKKSSLRHRLSSSTKTVVSVVS